MAKNISKTQFGLIVRARIAQYGYSESEFARLAKMNKSTLSRYLTGETTPDYKVALKICRLLNLDITKIDEMDVNELENDVGSVLLLRKEFERLGIIKEGQDLSKKQLDLLKGLIITNKEMFQLIDKTLSADDLDLSNIIATIGNDIKKK